MTELVFPVVGAMVVFLLAVPVLTLGAHSLLALGSRFTDGVGTHASPWRFVQKGRTPWLLVPGAASLALFAWLLTLHPSGAGRTYAAYGGVYIAVALLWLWIVEGERPTASDVVGASVALAGMAIIVLGSRR